MFSQLAKLVTFVTLITFTLAENEPQAKKESLKDIFDNDSEFMRGFETGLFLRTKGGSVEEYGCKVPTESSKGAKGAFDMIKMNIEMAKSSLRLDPIIEEALQIIIDVLDGLFYFYTILSPVGRDHLDMYCTGMIFGLQGSKLLVKVANTLINPIKDGEVESTFGGKKKMPDLGSMFESLAEGLMNTAKNTYMKHAAGGNDEL
jgi:hypothetical protein